MSEENKEVKANRKKAKAKLAKMIKGFGSVGIGPNGLEVRLKADKADDKLVNSIPNKLHGINVNVVMMGKISKR